VPGLLRARRIRTGVGARVGDAMSHTHGSARRIAWDEATQRTLWDFWTRDANGARGPLMRPEGNGPKPLSSGPGISPEGVT